MSPKVADKPTRRMRPADRELEPGQERAHVNAPLGIEQSMKLVDHDGLGVREESGYIRAAQDEHRFQRFRGDQQDAARVFPGAGLHGLRDVAVPGVDRHLQRLAQLFQPPELIVDERSKGPDIDQVEAVATAGHQGLRDQRQEGRLGLSPCCCGRND